MLDIKTLHGLSCIQLAAGNKEILDILEDYITPEQVFPLKGVFAKNERGYRFNAIKSAFDRY